MHINKILGQIPKAKPLALASAMSLMTLLPMAAKSQPQSDTFERKVEQCNLSDHAKISNKKTQICADKNHIGTEDNRASSGAFVFWFIYGFIAIACLAADLPNGD